jgi:hypothetical protein
MAESSGVRSAFPWMVVACLVGYAASCASSTSPSDSRLPTGVWGGDHVAMTVSAGGAHLEFDCAHGDIGQPLMVDDSGRLSVDGTFTQEHGGPIRVGETEDKKPARYSGKLSGETMTLSVTLTDTKETVGSFTVTRGGDARVRKCL